MQSSPYNLRTPQTATPRSALPRRRSLRHHAKQNTSYDVESEDENGTDEEDESMDTTCSPYKSEKDLRRGSLCQLLSADLVPSFDSRILVVGAYEAGKTTLVSNLIGNEIPRERESTDGINVYFGKLLFDLKTQKLLTNTKGVHSFPKAIYQKILSYLQSVKIEDVTQQMDTSSGKTKGKKLSKK